MGFFNMAANEWVNVAGFFTVLAITMGGTGWAITLLVTAQLNTMRDKIIEAFRNEINSLDTKFNLLNERVLLLEQYNKFQESIHSMQNKR